MLRSYERVKFYISGANMPGEGELKCIDWLKHMCKPDSEESAVIVGGDADLVLQGLALREVRQNSSHTMLHFNHHGVSLAGTEETGMG